MVEQWVASETLPLPGQGRTWERFEGLADLAAVDLSLARLVEGHVDAVAVLDELGGAATHEEDGNGGARSPARAVWAARRPGELIATPTSTGWELTGEKPFCSGAGLVARALVVADAPDGVRLFDLDVTDVEVVAGTWPAVGMAASASSRVAWRGASVSGCRAVGPPGAYTDRVGFWWGAVGVAACWWGGARALLDTVRCHLDAATAGDVVLAELGAGWARLDAAAAVLRHAAGQIDAAGARRESAAGTGQRSSVAGDRGGEIDAARRIALLTRHVVHDACTVALEAAAAAGGARPVCLDPVQSRRSADLYAYLAQHHRGRDAAALGRLVAEEGPMIGDRVVTGERVVGDERWGADRP